MPTQAQPLSAQQHRLWLRKKSGNTCFKRRDRQHRSTRYLQDCENSESSALIKGRGLGCEDDEGKSIKKMEEVEDGLVELAVEDYKHDSAVTLGVTPGRLVENFDRGDIATSQSCE